MEGLGSLLLFAVLFFVMMRWGCGAHMMHGHRGHGESHQGDRGGTGSVYIDPVCGMEVKDEKGYSMVHQGRHYHFCSRNCLEKFDVDPERYLNKVQGEGHGM